MFQTTYPGQGRGIGLSFNACFLVLCSRTPNMEGDQTPRRQCELCTQSFKTTKSLKNHYLTKHGLDKEDPVVMSTPKSPKKLCKRCGKQVSNPWAHKHFCKAIHGEATTSAEPSPVKEPQVSAPQLSTPAPGVPTATQAAKPDRMSDDQFLSKYRAWLESANGNFAGEKTVRDYMRQIISFITAQVKERPGFQARHWLGFGSRNFMTLGNVGQWIPRETKSALAGHKICAYKHLLGMIRSELVKAGGRSPNFAERIAHLDEMHRQATVLARNYKAGRFARASGEERREPTTVDTRGWRQLIKAYRKSVARATALQLFSGMFSRGVVNMEGDLISLHFLRRQHLAVFGTKRAERQVCTGAPSVGSLLPSCWLPIQHREEADRG